MLSEQVIEWPRGGNSQKTYTKNTQIIELSTIAISFWFMNGTLTSMSSTSWVPIWAETDWTETDWAELGLGRK